MNCPNCNSQINPGDAFCTSCGCNLNQVVQPQQNPSNSVPVEPVSSNVGVQINNIPVQQPISNNTVTIENQSVPVQTNSTMMMQTNTNVQSATASINNKNNIIVIMVVAVIAIATIITCCLITSKNSGNLNSTNVSQVNKVTVNGLTGNVPDGWSFEDSEGYIDSKDYVAVLRNEVGDSYLAIGSGDSLSYETIVSKKDLFIDYYTAIGLSNIVSKEEKYNNKNVLLVKGILDGYDFLVCYMSNGSNGYYLGAGTYSSNAAYEEMLQFMTTMESAKSTFSNSSSTISNTMVDDYFSKE